MKALFYMKSGNIIKTENVADVKTTINNNGDIVKYSITWEDEKRPNKLFTICLQEVEAIVVI